MACVCESYIIKCVNVNVCNVGTWTGITPAEGESGTWTGEIFFNGAKTEFGLEVEIGEEISILTSLLNENYVHEFRLYDTEGALFNCYKLHTTYSKTVAGAPVPPVSSGVWDWICLTANGNTVVSPYLEGEISPGLLMGSGGEINWSENGITHDAETGTLDLTAIGGFVGTICLQYRITI